MQQYWYIFTSLKSPCNIWFSQYVYIFSIIPLNGQGYSERIKIMVKYGPKKAIFSIKVTMNVTRSLTLVAFECLLELHVSFSNLSSTCRNSMLRPLPLWPINLLGFISTLFLFVLGTEKTRVTCKSCEARSVSIRFTHDLCPFISQYKQNNCTSILYAKAANNQ